MVIPMPSTLTLEHLLTDPAAAPHTPCAGTMELTGSLVGQRSPCLVMLFPFQGTCEAVIDGHYTPVTAHHVVVAPRGTLVALRAPARSPCTVRWLAVPHLALEGPQRLRQPPGQHVQHLWSYLSTATTTDAGITTLIESLVALALHGDAAPGPSA